MDHPQLSTRSILELVHGRKMCHGQIGQALHFLDEIQYVKDWGGGKGSRHGNVKIFLSDKPRHNCFEEPLSDGEN